MKIVFVTGASGSGKTTLSDMIAPQLAAQGIDVHHFDDLGVPSEAEMTAQYGSPKDWQRHQTAVWVEKLAQAGRPAVLEGSAAFAFIRAACAAHGVEGRIVLVDCADDVRTLRLTGGRNQPDLACASMLNWAQALREQAVREGVAILSSDAADKDAQAAQLLSIVTGFISG